MPDNKKQDMESRSEKLNDYGVGIQQGWVRRCAALNITFKAMTLLAAEKMKQRGEMQKLQADQLAPRVNVWRYAPPPVVILLHEWYKERAAHWFPEDHNEPGDLLDILRYIRETLVCADPIGGLPPGVQQYIGIEEIILELEAKFSAE